jgi:hypothetical protein
MEALRRREEALVDFARRERDLQLRRLREEVATCTAHLQHTTALVQFCIEALKESDSSAFLQVVAQFSITNSFFHGFSSFLPFIADWDDVSQPRVQFGSDLATGNGRID